MLHKPGLFFFITIAISFILVSIAGLIAALRSKAQGDLVNDLVERLSRNDIPVDGVSVIDQSPLLVEIKLLSSDSAPDFWNKHLVWREAALSYKYGFPLDGFTLTILDSNAELVDSIQVFLNPGDPSQKDYPFRSSTADDQVAVGLVKDRIDLYGLTLLDMNVNTGIGSFADVQLLKIRLFADDLDLANRAIPNLIPSLRPLLGKINQEPGARIAVVWLEVLGENDSQLLEYLWDIEVERQSWHMSEKITAKWFSTPYESGVTATPSLVPQAPTSQPYPQPTQSAYP